MKNRYIQISLAGCLLMFMLTSAMAQQQRRPSPPVEAFNACVNVAQGNDCSFTAPHGEVSGKCGMPGRESRLVCMPERGGQKGPLRQLSAVNHKQRPVGRTHTVVQSDSQLVLQTASVEPKVQSSISIKESDDWRYIIANGISQHNVGAFPNRGNPHAIKEQEYHYKLPLKPEITNRITSAYGYVFGIAVNGVVFDPGAAEFFNGQHGGVWQYEALSGAIELGFDENHAHVQPSGMYHYHGLPTLLLEDLGNSQVEHSSLVGWAADGFPIYALYGYEDNNDAQSAIIELQSGYNLKNGQRPTGSSEPGGFYDGTFVFDYEYVAGSGSLDECNGKFTVTPDFPNGTYAYFLTRGFPVVPRCFKGQPSNDFQKRHVRFERDANL